jgi:hypothetical protein
MKECNELLVIRYCGKPAISLHSHHVQWTIRLLPVMRDPGSKLQTPGGYLTEIGILLLAALPYLKCNGSATVTSY